MRVTEKIKLLNQIANILQENYSYDDIQLFLSEFNALNEHPEEYFYNNNSSWGSFVKDNLKDLSDDKLNEIIYELGLSKERLKNNPPKNWENSNQIKAFISHISKNKDMAKSLRDELKKHDINAFVAHEDIKPSEEWQIEIDKALQTMDFFISMHTEGFCDSVWCQQEVGYAVARNVKIIPVKFSEDPQGFISKIQALIRGKKRAKEVSQEIITILKDDPKTKSLFETQDESDSDILSEDEIPF